MRVVSWLVCVVFFVGGSLLIVVCCGVLCDVCCWMIYVCCVSFVGWCALCWLRFFSFSIRRRGCVFFSVSKDIPTGITALIVTMQPILTNALAGPFLKEHVGWKQWLGVILGFIGSAMVLGVDIGVTLPAIGIIASVIALLSITTATLFQKKYSGNIPLPVSNMYQAAGGCFFHLIIILFFVDPFIEFNSTFLIAMSHQIFLVSFGAFTILMFLIKNNSASKTVTVFFLIPATTSFMAWIFLNEQLTLIDLIGFIVASLGVFIATRVK